MVGDGDVAAAAANAAVSEAICYESVRPFVSSSLHHGDYRSLMTSSSLLFVIIIRRSVRRPRPARDSVYVRDDPSRLTSVHAAKLLISDVVAGR